VADGAHEETADGKSSTCRVSRRAVRFDNPPAVGDQLGASHRLARMTGDVFVVINRLARADDAVACALPLQEMMRDASGGSVGIYFPAVKSQLQPLKREARPIRSRRLVGSRQVF